MRHVISKDGDLGTQIGRALASAFPGDVIVVPNEYAATLANVGKMQVALRDPHLEGVMDKVSVVIEDPATPCSP